MQEDEFLIKFRVSGSGTGGQIPDVAHNVRFIKNLVEAAQARGQIHESLRVVGYEISNVQDMLPSKPRKQA